MVDATYQTKIYERQGGDTLVVASGGTILIESGGAITGPGGSSLIDGALCLDVADMSADATYYLVSPWAGTISKIYAVVDGAISTADITITANIGATAVTGGVVTLATAASAAGTNASATTSALNVITAGAALNLVIAGGGSAGSPKGHIVVVISR